MKKILILTAGLAIVALQAAPMEKMKACMGCHGEHFEKSALGKSKIVSQMSEKDIATALKGYQDGTYGGSMKSIMQAQAKGIKNPDMAAKHIYAIAHGEDPKAVMKAAEKTHCMNKLESIKECVSEAKNEEQMNECRTDLVKFAKKVEKKHSISVE